jgi:Cu/Ag efflux pump CusA
MTRKSSRSLHRSGVDQGAWGVLRLGGELIKMQIVVLSKIRAEIEKGKAAYQAILDGSATKMRPVCMVVITTVLGMMLVDPFFGAMAAGLMFGLALAVLLCLIVTPVLYAIFLSIRRPPEPNNYHDRVVLTHVRRSLRETRSRLWSSRFSPSARR